MSTLISPDNTWTLFAILVVVAALSIWMEQKFTWASKITGCVLALLMCMALSNFRIIPVDAPAYDFVWSYVVPLAVPLLLFKANINKILKESGRILIIYLISGIGTVVGGLLAFYLLTENIEALDSIAPMMVGTYTGGSVNLVAMSDAFGVTGDMTSAAIVADNLLMALYFFALIAIPATKVCLKHFKHPYIDEIERSLEAGGSSNQAANFWKAKPVALVDIAEAFAISFAIVAVSTMIADFFSAIIPTSNFLWALLNGLIGNKYLIMTTLTMTVASLFPGFIGEIAGAQELGTFMISIFFGVIGVPASIYLIITKAPLLLLFCGIIVFTNMIVTFVFGKLFRFSLEEICVASNANIGGPTTAAAYAIAKGWHAMVVPALLVGTLGYVIGNYYGIFVGTFLGQ